MMEKQHGRGHGHDDGDGGYGGDRGCGGRDRDCDLHVHAQLLLLYYGGDGHVKHALIHLLNDDVLLPHVHDDVYHGPLS